MESEGEVEVPANSLTLLVRGALRSLARGLALGVAIALVAAFADARSVSEDIVSCWILSLALTAPATLVDEFPHVQSRTRTLATLVLGVIGWVQCSLSVQALRLGRAPWAELASLPTEELYAYLKVAALVVWPVSVCSLASRVCRQRGDDEADTRQSLKVLTTANALAFALFFGFLHDTGWSAPQGLVLGGLLGAAIGSVGLGVAVPISIVYGSADAVLERLLAKVNRAAA